MIEVEMKFKLTPDQEKRLLDEAVLVNEVTNIDVFYDTADYRLTTDDIWLRTRNGRYELKIRLQTLDQENQGTVYNEIEDEAHIRDILKLDKDLPMEDALYAVGIEPFVRIEKDRRSFIKEGFHLDLDICDFGYELAEIELLVEDASQTQDALSRIQAFANRFELDSSPQRAKVIEYLFRFNPEHYRALIDAGMIEL